MFRDLMSNDHRHCDDLFAVTDTAIGKKQWAAAASSWAEFRQAMEAHLGAEENTLFPAFEQASGMTMGPTRVMRMEHDQIRELMADAARAIDDQLADAAAGYLDTLLIMMQQHNMKEENILYPMIDEHLSASAAELGEQVRQALSPR